MKRELRCACHGALLGYEVTPGDDNTGPCTDLPRVQQLRCETTVADLPLVQIEWMYPTVLERQHRDRYWRLADTPTIYAWRDGAWYWTVDGTEWSGRCEDAVEAVPGDYFVEVDGIPHRTIQKGDYA